MFWGFGCSVLVSAAFWFGGERVEPKNKAGRCALGLIERNTGVFFDTHQTLLGCFTI